jgi:hypothetical protein
VLYYADVIFYLFSLKGAVMQGYWIELFTPRATNDIKRFLPDNVTFIQNPSAEELKEISDAARRNEAKVLLECPAAYPGVEFGEEIYADSFKARSVVSDNWFGEKNITTFADCSAVLAALPGWIWKTAALLKNEKFENFVRSFPMELPENSTDFGSILASLLWAEGKAPVPRQDFSSYYKDMQLLFIRSGRLHAAMIGNRNSGGHHHLDIGGFIIAVDGREAILDLGSVTYTKDTFSEKRFNNPVLNSLYHNVPVFDRKSQGNGAEFAAKNVVYKQNGTKHTFSLDLKSAYPAETGLQKCIRTFVLDTETKTVSVTDEWEAGKSLQYSMTLFLPVPPEKSPLEIKSSLIARTEKFNVTDLSQKSYWGDTLWKSEYRASKATSGNHTFVFCLR